MVSSDKLLQHIMCSFDWQQVVGKTQMTIGLYSSQYSFPWLDVRFVILKVTTRQWSGDIHRSVPQTILCPLALAISFIVWQLTFQCFRLLFKTHIAANPFWKMDGWMIQLLMPSSDDKRIYSAHNFSSHWAYISCTLIISVHCGI